MSRPRWIDWLDEEDVAFLKRFVMASGSLKELAAAYGISYPTVRLRLDRLIAKVQLFERQHPLDEFERTVRALCVDGKIDRDTMRHLLAVHSRDPIQSPDKETRHDPSELSRTRDAGASSHRTRRA
ncbi:MAG: DUF2089 family protein [Planctomycetaceae bacterium]